MDGRRRNGGEQAREISHLGRLITKVDVLRAEIACTELTIIFRIKLNDSVGRYQVIDRHLDPGLTS